MNATRKDLIQAGIIVPIHRRARRKPYTDGKPFLPMDRFKPYTAGPQVQTFNDNDDPVPLGGVN